MCSIILSTLRIHTEQTAMSACTRNRSKSPIHIYYGMHILCHISKTVLCRIILPIVEVLEVVYSREVLFK